jgi:hypothetical protein
MCHRLPGVLIGNLKCLVSSSSDVLAEIIIVVDSVHGSIDPALEERARRVCEPVSVRFLYYSEKQARESERLRLPYVFSWLSWSIGIAHCETRHAILHDYDALILDDSLSERYSAFVDMSAFIQGISWYKVNGIVEEDRLATTFEAFLDVTRLRSFEPLRMFNQLGLIGGRSCDFDTLLELQCKEIPVSQRTVREMKQESLVHPSQMIHQYTMARRNPGKPDNCYSLPMIPFFDWLSGDGSALDEAAAAVSAGESRLVRLFGDSVEVNFALLERAQVDWLLKQMVQVCIARGESPFSSLSDYGDALYTLIGAGQDWLSKADFTEPQVNWLKRAGQTGDTNPVSSGNPA